MHFPFNAHPTLRCLLRHDNQAAKLQRLQRKSQKGLPELMSYHLLAQNIGRLNKATLETSKSKRYIQYHAGCGREANGKSSKCLQLDPQELGRLQRVN